MMPSPRLAYLILYVFIFITLVTCHKDTSPVPATDLELQLTSVSNRGDDTEEMEVFHGSVFTTYFPVPEENYRTVFTEVKGGVVQAILQRDSSVMATFSIVDLVDKPYAMKKYYAPIARLEEYPMVAKGQKGTAILVGSRFQVSVRSIELNFRESQRIEWLKKFNLEDLADLAN